MTSQVAQYFNRFYTLVLKNLISDPLVHSQWLYFQSMFKNDILQPERIELYLNILNNQHKKKESSNIRTRGSTNSIGSSEDKGIVAPQALNYADTSVKCHPTKLLKKYSQHWKTQVSISDGKSFPSLPLRTTTSCRDSDSQYTSSLSLKKVNSLQGHNDSEQRPRISEPTSVLSQRKQNSSVERSRPNAKAYLHSVASYQINKGITASQHQQLKDISQTLLAAFREQSSFLRA